MTLALNSLADAAYRLRQGRATGVFFLVALVVCVGLITLARADDWEDTSVYRLSARSSMISLAGRYVSAEGRLLSDQSYQTQADVGGLKLTGGRYIPLVIDGAPEPVFVYDSGIPAPDGNGAVRVVGKLTMGTGAQPPYYIEIGTPPNLPLQNVLARLGIVIGALLLLGWLVVWLIGRKDYALGAGSRVQDPPANVGALWFGSLGAEYGNAVVRHAPVIVSRSASELKLESASARPSWSIRIREVKQVKSTSVATAYGPLPAARIEFQDERGLLRHGTVAVGGEAAAREQLRGLLQGGTPK
jgi:hypothetical protein